MSNVCQINKSESIFRLFGLSLAKALQHAVRVSKNPNYFVSTWELPYTVAIFTLELFSKLYMNMYLITLFPPSYSNVK